MTRGSLSELAAQYRQEHAPKGEVVIVVGPPDKLPVNTVNVDSLLTTALESMSVRDAAATVASATGASRKHVYRRALELSRDSDIDRN